MWPSGKAQKQWLSEKRRFSASFQHRNLLSWTFLVIVGGVFSLPNVGGQPLAGRGGAGGADAEEAE